VCIRDQFPKHYVKVLFGAFTAKVDRDDIFRSKVGNETLQYIL